MNDITALTQRMKAAAEKATPGEWSVQFGDEVYATDGVENEQVAIATNDARDADFIALANPANVLALVEALEKAQLEAFVNWEAAASMNVENQELKQHIAELESRTVTVKLPKRSVGEVMHMSGFSRDYAEGWCSGNDNAINEMKLAGIQVIEGEGQ